MDAVRTIVKRLTEKLGLMVAGSKRAFLVARRDDRTPLPWRSISFTLIRLHLSHLFRIYRVNCVLDVGANEGQYALDLRQSGFTGHIFSFEPIEELYAGLKKLSEDDPKWMVFPYALGSTNGEEQINVLEASSFSSLLKTNEYAHERFGPKVTVRETREVQVKRLDSILEEILENIPKPRIYLKMDTQGYDLEVFEGVGEAIEYFVGLQSEISFLAIYDEMPDLSKTLAAYESKGFEVTGFFPVSFDKASLSLIEVDCVMMRPDMLDIK